MTTDPMLTNVPLVLIADDDKFMRIQISHAMKQEGYRVEVVEDGEQCLIAYTHLHPDIVLLDVRMPVMDGFTCCARLQALPDAEFTPVLLITGLEDQGSVDLAFESGAADYVTKPIHWAVLRQRVRRLIQQSAQSRQITTLLKKVEQANDELQRLVAIDGLTQIANRRCFDEYLDQEWRRLAREQAPLSLILCDIDFFKLYNDSYGHQAGDYCLQEIAKAISIATKRPADLVARYGGEEFAIILPQTEADGAVQLAETIRVTVRELRTVYLNPQSQTPLTLSFGVASTIPTAQMTPAMLINTADKALYQAKAGGRDRVIVNLEMVSSKTI